MTFITRHKIPLFLLLFGILLFANTLTFDRLRTWDDNRHLDENQWVQQFKVGRILTEPYFGAFIPVSHLAYASEYQLWGLNPAGYHAVNLLLHALNAMLAFSLLLKLTGKEVAALIGALLFVCHPVQVETVAWITQQKNILSMFFFLLTFICHINSRAKASRRWQVASWGFYLLAVLSKATVVGVPLLLFAYDYFWAKLSFRRALLNAVVPLLLALFCAVITFKTQAQVGGVQTYWGGSFKSAIQLTFLVAWEYLAGLLNPTLLDSRYMYVPPDAITGNFRVWAGLLLILILLGAGLYSLVRFFKSKEQPPMVFFLFLWLTVFMLPVSNIIPLSIQRADRYMYFPSMLLFLMVGLGWQWLWQHVRQRYQRGLLATALCSVIIFFSTATYFQNQVWADDGTLWTEHLKVYPNDDVAINNLALHYYINGLYAKADPLYKKLIPLDPDNYKPPLFLGLMAFDQERYDESIFLLNQALPLAQAEFERTEKSSIEGIEKNVIDGILENLLGVYGKAIEKAGVEGRFTDQLAYYQRVAEILPNNPEVHNNIGQIHQKLGHFKKARAAYQAAMDNAGQYYALAHANMGYLLLETGKLKEAQAVFEEGLGKEPTARAAMGLCEVMTTEKNYDVALGACYQAVGLSPNTPMCYDQLVKTLLMAHPFAKAISHVAGHLAQAADLKNMVIGYLHSKKAQYKAALESYQKSNLILAQLKIGETATKLEKYKLADKAYQEVLNDSPGFMQAVSGRCVALSKLGDYKEALSFCQSAATKNAEDSRYLVAYADALVAQKRSKEAISYYKKALNSNQPEVAEKLARAVAESQAAAN